MTTSRAESDARKRHGRLGPGYLVLGVLYAVGLAGLAITAAAPELTSRDALHPAWVSGLFAPGAWYTALAIVFLTLVLAQRVHRLSGAAPGRFDPWMASFLIGSFMVLSLTAYTSCQMHYSPSDSSSFTGTGPFDVVLQPLLDSMALFTFTYNDPFVTGSAQCDYVPPLAMLTSRIIAALTTASAVFAVIISLSDRTKTIRTVRKAPSIDVAIGLDTESADFLSSIAQAAGNADTSRNQLVVLTRLPEREEVQRLRTEGVLVIRVDLDDLTAIRDIFQSTPIENLFLLHSDASQNLKRFDDILRQWKTADHHQSLRKRVSAGVTDLLHGIDDLLAGIAPHRTGAQTREPAPAISNVVVRIDNVWDAEDWRAREIGRRDVSVSVVGLYENTAQALVMPFRNPASDVLRTKFGATTMWRESPGSSADEPSDSTTHFVICGESQLALALLAALGQSAYEEGRLRTALNASAMRDGTEGWLPRELHHRGVTIHLISPLASSIAESFRSRVQRRQLLPDRDPDLHPIRIKAHDNVPDLSSVRQALESITSADPTSRPVVIVTETVSEHSGLLATMIADLPFPIEAVFEHSDTVRTPVSFGGSKLRRYGLNLGASMGENGEAARAIASLNDARAVAELLHAEYLLNWVSAKDAGLPQAERRSAQRLWDSLDQFYREDNVRPVRVALTTLREIRSPDREDSVLATTEAEDAALENWLGSLREVDSPGDDHRVSSILAILGAPRAQPVQQYLNAASPKSVLIALTRAEHQSWRDIRRSPGQGWRRPTPSERGFTPRREAGGTYLRFDAEQVSSRLELDRRRISPEVLEWVELISAEAQLVLLRESWDESTKGLRQKPDDADKAYADYIAQSPTLDPWKVFGQVVTVLGHLDALGYLSAVLGNDDAHIRGPS